nr:PREDICTED: cytochrome b-c1 complex subunit 8 [Bemisia tabaci]
MPSLTQVLRSDQWGGMRKDIRHIVYHQISPYEQKAFKGFFSEGFPNAIRRIRLRMFKILMPFTGALVLVDWAKKENEKIHRKNPADYENDE